MWMRGQQASGRQKPFLCPAPNRQDIESSVFVSMSTLLYGRLELAPLVLPNGHLLTTTRLSDNQKGDDRQKRSRFLFIVNAYTRTSVCLVACPTSPFGSIEAPFLYQLEAVTRCRLYGSSPRRTKKSTASALIGTFVSANA